MLVVGKFRRDNSVLMTYFHFHSKKLPADQESQVKENIVMIDKIPL